MNENNDSILLVDDNDTVTGKAEKGRVHTEGLLHRAFSIFIFNDEGELLIHRRADSKYHSPGVWTNACCSHQTTVHGEMQYIHNRLRMEMGIDTELVFLFKHRYKATFENGLTEHEYDHVYYGVYNGDPVPDPVEVSDWQWYDSESVLEEIKKQPEKYSYWFRELYPLVYNDSRIQFMLD